MTEEKDWKQKTAREVIGDIYHQAMIYPYVIKALNLAEEKCKRETGFLNNKYEHDMKLKQIEITRLKARELRNFASWEESTEKLKAEHEKEKRRLNKKYSEALISAIDISNAQKRQAIRKKLEEFEQEITKERNIASTYKTEVARQSVIVFTSIIHYLEKHFAEYLKEKK